MFSDLTMLVIMSTASMEAEFADENANSSDLKQINCCESDSNVRMIEAV